MFYNPYDEDKVVTFKGFNDNYDLFDLTAIAYLAAICWESAHFVTKESALVLRFYRRIVS